MGNASRKNSRASNDLFLDKEDEVDGRNFQDALAREHRDHINSTKNTMQRRSSSATTKSPEHQQQNRTTGRFPSPSPNRLAVADNPSVNGPSVASRTRARSLSARKAREGGKNQNKQNGSNSVRLRRTSDFSTAEEENHLNLSPGQIVMVRKLWQHARVQGENAPGMAILREHLFFRCPDIRETFAHAATSGQGEPSYHTRLQCHAEWLTALLDEVIANLERVHVLIEKIRACGRAHAGLREAGFAAVYWNRFSEACNACTLTWCQKSQRCFDAQVALTTIVLFITEHLKDGYYEECRRLRRSVYDGNRRVDSTPTRHPSTDRRRVAMDER